MDSPGFKDFYFYDIEKEDVKYLFKEFIEIQKNCKFNNCLHLNEPNCEIKKILVIKYGVKGSVVIYQ